MTYEEYQDALIVAAKKIQGDNYIGDDLYLQDCWKKSWEARIDPAEVVLEDMSYWD